MLEINNLQKNFKNGTHALKGVSFNVKRGEFISILGPSGSGKTTLLRSINGLESIENGEIIFNKDKIDTGSLPDVQRKTGMIFQEFNLVNNLSSINNVVFPDPLGPNIEINSPLLTLKLTPFNA